MQTRSLFISRDVVFHENFFPFHSIKPNSDPIDPFPNVCLPVPLPDPPASDTTTLHSPSLTDAQLDTPPNDSSITTNPLPPPVP